MSKTKILFFVLIITILLSGCSFKKAKLEVTGVDCTKFTPVCGEDGSTYYNECHAADSKVEVSYEGACNQVDSRSLPYEKLEQEEDTQKK